MPKLVKWTDRFSCCGGKDRSKDQSYFLYVLGQQQLAKAMFPIGNLTKGEVRELAQRAPFSHGRKEGQHRHLLYWGAELQGVSSPISTRPAG